MITTRQIRVKEKQPKKVELITTGGIEVKYIDEPIARKEDGTPIFAGPKEPAVTTHNLADVEAIAEKKRRDEIMAQKMESANVRNVDDEIGVPMTEDEETIFLRQYIIAEVDDDLMAFLRRDLK